MVACQLRRCIAERTDALQFCKQVGANLCAGRRVWELGSGAAARRHGGRAGGQAAQAGRGHTGWQGNRCGR